MITIFKNLFDNKPYYITPDAVFERIRTGGKHLDIINQIRSTSDKNQRNELKKQLAVILWSGKFTERRNSSLSEYSNLICLDFDNVEKPASFKAAVSMEPFVYACFLSPGGDGVKVIVKVSSKNHGAHFKALAKEFPSIDQSGKDLARSCFISYDPDLYVNEHADVYTKIVESVYNDEEKYEKLKAWLANKGEKFVSGNRNNFLARLVGACNRFGLSADFVLNVIKRDFIDSSSDFSIREAQSVVASIYTNYKDQHDTASFDEVIDEKDVDSILSTEIETNDIITVAEVKNDLMKDYDEGTPMGGTTYFPLLDNHFRLLKGEITTVTGLAGMGKSSFLTQLLTIRAAFNGEKFALLSMEQYPPVFFYKEIARALLGKPVEQGAKNRMTRAEYELALEWINQHFYFIYPSKDEPSPEWTMGRFYEAIAKYSVDGCVVDPYNTQSHDMSKAGGREDKYIAQMLNKSQRFALTNNTYFFIVAHPKSIGKKDDGTYKEPTADEISGGPVWWQRSDNILIYHRPSLPLDFQDPTCTVRSAKIKKQQINGKPGQVTMIYDWKISRYFENGYSPLDSFNL
jgi:hypothetical protein